MGKRIKEATSNAGLKSPVFKSDKPKYDVFTCICKAELGVEVVKELQFYPGRRWRFDYAIESHKIAIEVEGGAYKRRTYRDKRTGEMVTTIGGRHNSSSGFLGDMEKYNNATIAGWRVLRVIPQDLTKSATLNMIKQAINSN